jgi:hypothetical protein
MLSSSAIAVVDNHMEQSNTQMNFMGRELSGRSGAEDWTNCPSQSPAGISRKRVISDGAPRRLGGPQ